MTANQYFVPLLKNDNIVINVPGSKSITNRAFLIAALAPGKSILSNALESDDTHYMQQALQALGVEIKKERNTYIVSGLDGKFNSGDKEIYLGNAGTAVRFLTAAMILRNSKTKITGNQRMQERPLQDLLDGLKSLGAKIDCPTGCPPVLISGSQVENNIVSLAGNKSSQYFSAIMQIAPCLPKGVQLKVEGDLVSKPYIDITISVMEDFGVKVSNFDYQEFIIEKQSYHNIDYTIEADASSASYWFALAAISNKTVTVNNIALDSCQGDINFLGVLEKMGCKIQAVGNKITVTGPKKLKALGEIDMNAMPDVAMTLAIVAACAPGETKMINIANLRIKETDRITALASELQKMNISCQELKEGLVINGSNQRKGAEIETYDDHRMAMCFAVLGAVTPNIVILDPACVSKSYPSFFDDFDAVMKG